MGQAGDDTINVVSKMETLSQETLALS